MQLGNRIEDHKCSRCNQSLTIPAHYEAGFYFHQRCWQEGEHLLANAERIARALQPSLFIHESQYPLEDSAY